MACISARDSQTIWSFEWINNYLIAYVRFRFPYTKLIYVNKLIKSSDAIFFYFSSGSCDVVSKHIQHYIWREPSFYVYGQSWQWADILRNIYQLIKRIKVQNININKSNNGNTNFRLLNNYSCSFSFTPQLGHVRS